MPRKLIKSFEYAGAGTRHAIKTQRNLWIHFLAGLLVLFLAWWVKVNIVEFAILLLAIFGVIVVEMVNTAIEELVNILSPEHRVEAGLAKNVAAGAVLLSAVGAVIIGCLVFIPKVLGQ
ncbi:MAG: diacylglycerol kinase family protein [Candidatus Margulisbacteria bacterium]|nr:diacylglycerol kinase family protein [Candidatus Margulisiibacteriota bacterium]